MIFRNTNLILPAQHVGNDHRFLMGERVAKSFVQVCCCVCFSISFFIIALSEFEFTSVFFAFLLFIAVVMTSPYIQLFTFNNRQARIVL